MGLEQRLMLAVVHLSTALTNYPQTQRLRSTFYVFARESLIWTGLRTDDWRLLPVVSVGVGISMIAARLTHRTPRQRWLSGRAGRKSFPGILYLGPCFFPLAGFTVLFRVAVGLLLLVGSLHGVAELPRKKFWLTCFRGCKGGSF